MSNRRKNAQNCCFFRRALSSFLSKYAHEWVHQSGFHFDLDTNCFWEHELFLGTRIEHELFMNCSEINETINGH